MIIETKTLQDNCRKILDAVDTKTTSDDSDTLELEVVGESLYLNVTNREYYVSVKMPIGASDDFHVVVDAKLFLGLISKLTTEQVELKTTETNLIIKSNGNYKIGFVADENGTVKSLPKITIDNVTNSFPISNSILQSILRYNSNELRMSGSLSPVHKLFYIDNEGALTFSNGACINSFTLDNPVNLFLNEKIIKLFKLFKNDVSFSIGQDLIGDKFVTKVSFSDGAVSLVSKLDIDESITAKFPIKLIRGLASSSFEYTVALDKDLLLDSINRLSLFTSKSGELFTYMTFGAESVTVYDTAKDNYEVINYPSDTLAITEDYTIKLNTIDLRLILEKCEDKYINVSFGDRRAFVITRGNVKTILAENR